MVKHITLCSRTSKICGLHSPETVMTNVTSNHDVPPVGQPTKNTSLVDTTEKVVEVQVVDKSLPTSQRIVDSRLTGKC